jgi:hypothetical protein
VWLFPICDLNYFPINPPSIATVAVLHAIGIWNELILPTIYLTNKDYYPITRGMIVFQGVYGSNWPTLAAAVLTLPMLLIFLLLQRYIISGLPREQSRDRAGLCPSVIIARLAICPRCWLVKAKECRLLFVAISRQF